MKNEALTERGIIAWMANNSVAANLLMLVVMIGGYASLGGITKEVFPTFPTETVSVTVPYPGSSPEEVEQGIVLRLEEAVQDVVGIKELTSEAREGVGTLYVEMEPGTDMNWALTQIKTRIDGISSFPVDAEEPVVDVDQWRMRAMRLSLFGDLSEYQFKELADELREELLQLPDVTQVSISGVRDYEMVIEVSETALEKYNLSFDTVVTAVRKQSRDLPGGKLRTGTGAITLRSVGQAYTGVEYGDLTIITRPDGTRLRLADVATIDDGFVEQPVLSRLNGKPSVTLGVDQVDGQDVLSMTQTLREWADARQDTLPEGVELVAWSDRSVILNGRINLMLNSALQGALLVVLMLALFLDLSLAFWVILGVPFSFFGALLSIYVLNLPVSINVISVFGFILVLGMLVDDGIVTAESAYARLEDEHDGVNSVVRGVKRVAVATVFGAITTIVAFLPALTLDAGMARFMTQIVPVVAFSMLFSLLETKLILPAHLRHIRVFKPRDDGSLKSKLLRFQRRCANGLQAVASHHYRPLLELAVRHRYTTVALFLGGLVICLSLAPAGLVRMVFFPNVPSDSINISLKMPQGTPWQTTHAYSLKIEEAIRAMDERYRQELGAGDGVVLELMSYSRTDTESFIVAELTPSEQRDVSSIQLARWVRESLGELPGVEALTFDANAGPSGAPIDVELNGADLGQMRAAAQELKQAIARFDGVSDVRDTFDAGGPELDIQLTEQGDAMGLGQVELARQVRQAFFGAQVQRVQRGRHEVRVYVRLPAKDRESLSALRTLWITLPSGDRVPFDVVGKAVEHSGVSVIKRVDRQRVVNVQADVDKSRVQPGAINAQISANVVPTILARHPGVSFTLSGEAEEQAETTKALGAGFVLIMLMIYGALAIPLKSYAQPLIIMAVIPFGIVGAILGHLLLGADLSILSMIGIMGLTGIVVNDSLVLVDHINATLQRQDGDWREQVIAAAIRRFRPVVLTSMTTFVGLLPIQMETAIQAQFVKPMAISVAFGVLFATFVTLLLVPCLYFIGRDIRALFAGPPQVDSSYG